MSPTTRYNQEVKHRDDRRRRTSKKPDISSVESSTEGDSSQQSQRSIVYLHAATGNYSYRFLKRSASN